MNINEEIFSRGTLLLGEEAMQRIHGSRVIIFGVGGVGSWAAEALVRTGVEKLAIVDSDVVNPSNINRQLMATSATIGEVKVEALKKHLLTINPQAEITAIPGIYCRELTAEFNFNSYDVIIDAIDSLRHKADLILESTRSKATLVSSMGAALKLDPTKIDVAEFWKVKGCPLAAALRRRFKKGGEFPAKKFKCVYSPELVPNKSIVQPSSQASIWDLQKARINGSLVHITGTFGFILASLAIDAIIKSRL